MVMAPGANTALGAAQCSWTLECGNPSAFGDYAAVALLPLDDKRHPKGSSTFPGFPGLDAVEWWARENLLQLESRPTSDRCRQGALGRVHLLGNGASKRPAITPLADRLSDRVQLEPVRQW